MSDPVMEFLEEEKAIVRSAPDGSVKDFLGSCLLPHRLQHCLHLLSLPLGEIMRTNSLLEELQAPFLLPNPQQLLGSSFIRSKASHLSNEVSHKFVVLSQLALLFARFGHQGVRGGLVALF